MKSKSDGQLLAALQETVSSVLKQWLTENKDEVLEALRNSALAFDAIKQRRQAPPKQPVNHANLLTVSDLAERWQFHPESIRKMIRQGRVPSVIIGRRKRVPLAAVEAFERDSKASWAR